MEDFIEKLKSKNNNNNTKSFYNAFGLGNKNEDILYYPMYQSFYNRKISCNIDDCQNAIKLKVKRAIDYINDKNIQYIDFIKIDTEGNEFEVLKGFDNKIQIVKIIQFEYGGTFKDAEVKLNDIIIYLKKYGFEDFSYLYPDGRRIINNFNDHYKYCNIVCRNSKFKDLIF